MIFPLLLLFLLAACGRPTSSVMEEPAADAAADDANVAATATGDREPADDVSMEERQVVIWAPEFWMASEETPAGQVVENAITQFEQAHDGTKVEIHTKAEAGAADMLSLLRSAQKAAPAVLPDAVLMDAQDLWRLVDLGMVEPLTDTASLHTDTFFPFALESVVYNGQPYGIPYAADLLHVSAIDLTERPMPADWDVLLADERRYLFPADGKDGILSLLLQYVGAGGEFAVTDAAAEETVLTALFEFYAAGVVAGVIPAQNVDLETLDAAWKVMDPEASDIVETSAAFLLRQNEMPSGIRYAPSPTRDGAPISIARTWAFVVLADDSGQRAQVIELLQVLLDPNVQGQWSLFTRLLPTTDGAAAAWGANHPYTDYVLALLGEESTRAVPNGRSFSEFVNALQAAQQAVLTGQMTPQDAAASVQPTP